MRCILIYKNVTWRSPRPMKRPTMEPTSKPSDRPTQRIQLFTRYTSLIFYSKWNFYSRCVSGSIDVIEASSSISALRHSFRRRQCSFEGITIDDADDIKLSIIFTSCSERLRAEGQVFFKNKLSSPLIDFFSEVFVRTSQWPNSWFPDGKTQEYITERRFQN